MPKHFVIVNISEGKINNPKPLKTLFDSLKDGKYEVEVSPVSKRSNPQNRYLHGLLIPQFRNALNQVGYDEVKTDAQAKSIMKSMFLVAETTNKETGEMIKYIKNTRDLSKEELGILIEDVIKFAAEHMNYQIPYPSEQMMISY